MLNPKWQILCCLYRFNKIMCYIWLKKAKYHFWGSKTIYFSFPFLWAWGRKFETVADWVIRVGSARGDRRSKRRKDQRQATDTSDWRRPLKANSKRKMPKENPNRKWKQEIRKKTTANLQFWFLPWVRRSLFGSLAFSFAFEFRPCASRAAWNCKSGYCGLFVLLILWHSLFSSCEITMLFRFVLSTYSLHGVCSRDRRHCTRARHRCFSWKRWIEPKIIVLMM